MGHTRQKRDALYYELEEYRGRLRKLKFRSKSTRDLQRELDEDLRAYEDEMPSVAPETSELSAAEGQS